jgi:glycosyltransferase involved in cell wall biosynthesis
MKVVHLITGTNIGGAEIMLQRYLAALGPEAGRHSVISLLPEGAVARQIRELGVRVLSAGFAQGRASLSGLWRLRRLLRQADPDVVHAWMYHGCLAASCSLAGAGRRRPGLIWAIHHSLQDIRNERFATRFILRLMARLSGHPGMISYCSEASRRQHEAIGFAARRSSLIANAVDTAVFRPDPGARARLAALCGVPEGRLLIGNVARSHPMKDHVSMVRAAARLLQAGHDVQAVIIGNQVPGGPAVQEAERLGIGGRLSTFGARSDIAALMPGFDVFLLSSAWGEAFPLSVSEAMACGVPCVVTDVGDCALLVGDCGQVVPPGDPDAMAAAAARLLETGPEGRRRLGLSSRRRVEQEFSLQRYIGMYSAAYDQVQAARGPCRRNVP